MIITGKDLIIYILQNGLENDNVFENGIFVGLMSMEEAAVKFNVGVATVEFWYATGIIDGITAGDKIYFRKDLEDPRSIINIVVEG